VASPKNRLWSVEEGTDEVRWRLTVLEAGWYRYSSKALTQEQAAQLFQEFAVVLLPKGL
jgi:hypothetical protein